MAISAELPKVTYRKAMEDIYTAVNTLETTVSGISAAELGFVDGVVAGTATASKAVVLGASKDIATITSATITTLTSTTGNVTTVNATNVDAGASGTVGTVDIFPTTASKGKIQITAADSAGDTTTTITNASQSGARTYTIPDAGESASFVMTEGTQTINDAKTFGGAVTFSSTVTRTGRQMIVPICGNAKVGATAGWVITAGTDICHATLPASQTSSTLVVPISGLCVGDTITRVDAVGQVESAGNNVTLVMSVRKLTAGTADNTDAEIATDNVGTLTADTEISSANLGVVLGTPEVLAATETCYVLLTGTTAASTDIDLMGLVVTYTQA